MKGAELTLYDVLAKESGGMRSRDRRRASLRQLTRFGIGGEAALLVDASNEASLGAVLQRDREHGVRHM